MKLGKKLKVKGTKLTATLVGNAMIEDDGKIVERQVVVLDLSTATIKDLPLLKYVVLDSSLLEE